MDLKYLVLFVIIIVIIALLYWFYKLFIIQQTTVVETINLGQSKTIGDTSSEPVCHYDFWLYVNSWTTGEKTILTTSESRLKVVLSSSTPTLSLVTKTSNGTSGFETNTLTTSFPLQSWVHVTINIDSNVVDYYMNGKLVTSFKLEKMMEFKNPNEITLGGNNSSGVLMSQFVKRNIRIGPADVQKNYSSSAMASIDIPNYKMDLTILKDGELSKKINLL